MLLLFTGGAQYWNKSTMVCRLLVLSYERVTLSQGSPQSEVKRRRRLPCWCQITENRRHRTKKPLSVSRAVNSTGAVDSRDSEASLPAEISAPAAARLGSTPRGAGRAGPCRTGPGLSARPPCLPSAAAVNGPRSHPAGLLTSAHRPSPARPEPCGRGMRRAPAGEGEGAPARPRPPPQGARRGRQATAGRGPCCCKHRHARDVTQRAQPRRRGRPRVTLRHVTSPRGDGGAPINNARACARALPARGRGERDGAQRGRHRRRGRGHARRPPYSPPSPSIFIPLFQVPAPPPAAAAGGRDDAIRFPERWRAGSGAARGGGGGGGGEAVGMRAGLRCLKGAASPGPAPGRGAALTDGRSWRGRGEERGGGGIRSHRAQPGSSPRCRSRRSGEGPRGPVPAQSLPGALPRGRARPRGERGAGRGRVAGAEARPGCRPAEGSSAWRRTWPLRGCLPSVCPPGRGSGPKRRGHRAGSSSSPGSSAEAAATGRACRGWGSGWSGSLHRRLAAVAAERLPEGGRGPLRPGLAGTRGRGTPGAGPEQPQQQQRGVDSACPPPWGEPQIHIVNKTTLIHKGRSPECAFCTFLAETQRHRTPQ